MVPRWRRPQLSTCPTPPSLASSLVTRWRFRWRSTSSFSASSTSLPAMYLTAIPGALFPIYVRHERSCVGSSGFSASPLTWVTATIRTFMTKSLGGILIRWLQLSSPQYPLGHMTLCSTDAQTSFNRALSWHTVQWGYHRDHAYTHQHVSSCVGSLRYMYYVSSKHNMIPSKKETAPGTTANSGTYLLQPHRTHQLKSQLRLQIISFIHYGGVTVCTVQWGCHGDYAEIMLTCIHISGVQSNMFTVQATAIQSSPLTSPRHWGQFLIISMGPDDHNEWFYAEGLAISTSNWNRQFVSAIAYLLFI